LSQRGCRKQGTRP